MILEGVTLKSTGSYLPSKIRTNSQIENSAPTTATWIEERLGIKERRTVTEETLSDIAYQAATSALAASSASKEDIDMIIVATSSPERISPATACTVHDMLKIEKNIPCFDINAVCAGFVFAMHLAAPLISNGAYKNIMIIGAETYSKITDWTDRNSVFFGDGAGAVILTTSEKGWISSKIKSDGSGTGSTGFTCPLIGKYKTNPREVWEAATGRLPTSITEVLEQSGLTKDDIDIFVPHQASIHMLKDIAGKVEIPENKVKTVMDRYGNIAGASIPIALDDAFKNKEIARGDKILLSAIGSGWSWGSMVIAYE